MGRYFRILISFWSAALAAEMEYRTNFLIATLSSVGGMAGSVFTLSLFYRGDYQFGSWVWEEALIVLGIFTLLKGFSNIFLDPNLNRIVKHVQQGTLDFVLLKPISSQFWLSSRALSPWGIPDLIVGSSLIAYAGGKLQLEFGDYLLSTIPLVFGLVSLYSIWFMLGATSIWFVKIYNVTEVLRGLLEAGRFPMSAYPTVFRFFFTFVVPVAFMTTVPAGVMLGWPDADAIAGAGKLTLVFWILGGGGLALGLLLVSGCFWRFALRFYTSASS